MAWTLNSGAADSDSTTDGFIRSVTSGFVALRVTTTGTAVAPRGFGVSAGSVTVGLSTGGTAGTFISYSATATAGSFIFAATANGTGNFNTTLTNTSIGQSTVYALPDVGEATGRVLCKGSAAATDTALVKFSGTAGLVTSSTVLAANGNIYFPSAGTIVLKSSGAAATAGTTAAMSGTPGVVTVNTTAATATAKINVTRVTAGGTLGNVTVSRSAGVSFTITSTGNETSTFDWSIIESAA